MSGKHLHAAYLYRQVLDHPLITYLIYSFDVVMGYVKWGLYGGRREYLREFATPSAPSIHVMPSWPYLKVYSTSFQKTLVSLPDAKKGEHVIFAEMVHVNNPYYRVNVTQFMNEMFKVYNKTLFSEVTLMLQGAYNMTYVHSDDIIINVITPDYSTHFFDKSKERVSLDDQVAAEISYKYESTFSLRRNL